MAGAGAPDLIFLRAALIEGYSIRLLKPGHSGAGRQIGISGIIAALGVVACLSIAIKVFWQWTVINRSKDIVSVAAKVLKLASDMPRVVNRESA
ncbi:hypothetical protein [Sodalis-like endosymbiont of Proechinophthirus fluctus]|uniref:hypothetical protein n=1 Tax=Sodalis-like endosymbiont of Proechinophthirus fluctus TaxID=1462730 RepID=UPI001650BA5A|nr:hypothetical protein [Sodalis-like endosymbiont of Proechinophthirus fluctus]